MKKSHRKDVIIARIIFACMVLVLVLVIVFAVKAVMKYQAAHTVQEPVPTESQQSETNGGEDTSTGSDAADEPDEPDDNEEWIIDGTESESTEGAGDEGESETDAEGGAENDGEQVTLKARYSVNVRSGAGKDYSIVGGVAEGGTVILLEEEDNGWGLIQKGDLTGYVYLEYFLILDEE